MAQRAAIAILGVLVLAAIGYNLLSWKVGSSEAPVAAPESPAAATSAMQSGSRAEALAPAATAAAPAPTVTAVTWQGDGGAIEAQLTAAVDVEHAATASGAEFDESAERIFVSIRSTLPETASVSVVWRRLANAMVPAQDLHDQAVVVPSGSRRSAFLRPGRSGFLPGDYELEISVGNINPEKLPFRVGSKFTDARQVVNADGLPGLNAATAALGGRVASATAGLKSPAWVADNLIDGFAFRIGGAGGCDICGWTSGGADAPYEIVFDLAGDAPVTIDGVVIDPSTAETTSGSQWNLIPRNVEILVANSEGGDFTTAAAARVQPAAIEQLIALPPTPARFVKLRILSNWGGNTTQIGEVKVLEAAGNTAITAPRNIALPALGGVVARFTSQDSPRNGVQNLIDNAIEEPWIAADDYLPQDFVFAFKDDQVARIAAVELRPGGRRPQSYPKRVMVSVSDHSLFDFSDVTTLELPAEDRDHSIPVNREARFVRVRVLENHGDRETGLNEIRVIEAAAAGYTSVAARTAPHAVTRADTVATTLTADLEEAEANDEPARANALAIGKSIGGTISPLGELDHFAIEVPAGAPQMLNLAVSSPPYIKTSISLLDGSGTETKRFDPAQAAAGATNISWQIGSGRHTLRVAEPPASIVLVWDTSLSMDGMTDELRTAVLAYLAQVRPTERLNLIRFSDDVEVLLPQFTSDVDLLRAAASAEKFYPFGGTRIYDAIEQAVGLLASQTGNRAIIVLSDGEDSLSKLTPGGFWSMLEREQVRLYSIGLGVALKGFATRIGSTGQRFLGHASHATNGRTFFAREPAQLQAVYGRIAEELRHVSRYTLTPALTTATGELAVAATGERLAAVSAPSRVQLVLDASGSMNRRIGNRRMIDIAKDVLSSLVTTLPTDVHVGMRVYGHRIKEGARGACEDSQQVQPIAPLNRDRLLARIRAINALGTTPIAYSLQQVATDLKSGGGPQMVVLVTDGREECNGDPKAAIELLKAQGLQVRVNIVGFALTDAAAQKQLAEAAALSGGTYVTARDGDALKTALEDALRVPFEVRDSAGAVVAAARVGDKAVTLPAGTFTVVVQTAGRELTINGVRVEPGKATNIELKKEGRDVGIKVNTP